MRAYTFSLLAVLVLAVGCVSQLPRQPQTRGEIALEFVCEQLNADCADLQPPKIEYVDLAAMGMPGAAGAFDPYNPYVIYLDYRLVDQDLIMRVIVHETMHFVDFHKQLTMVLGSDRRIVEGLAHMVDTMWDAQQHGKEYPVRVTVR
jgi:hypothetical protein